MSGQTQKVLVAYFSRPGQNYVHGIPRTIAVGNTEAAAKTIVALTGSDEFRIETVKPYPDGYKETTEVAKDELRRQARPALKSKPPKLDGYDLIVVGYPNWWGNMPMPMYSFLEACDFAGKKILPLCTHEGSGLGRTEAELRRVCPKAEVLKGLAVQGSLVADAAPALKRWLAEAGVIA